MKKILFLSLILFILTSCNNKEDGFELCGSGILKPYYLTGLSYSGDIYSIKETFKNEYIPILEKPNINGIIKIRFDINCKGETGNFVYETYNLEYEKAELNNLITTQILSITKKLKSWIPGTNDKGKPINSFKFLAFRIIDGKIVDILPK